MPQGRQGSAQRQPCAVCKQQKKKCDEDCEMAPYFPGSKIHEFRSASKIFGVANIYRMMNLVPLARKQAAADTILKEGTARTNDPVYGSFGIYQKLEAEIESLKKELEVVNQHLAVYRQREKIDLNFPPPEPEPSESMDEMKRYEHGYVYRGGNEQAFDIQLMEQAILELSSESKAGKKRYEEGYVYRSTSEAADEMTFDIQLMEPAILEVDPEENGLPFFSGPGESSSAAAVSKAKGKRPMECLEEEETEGDQAGPSTTEMERDEHQELMNFTIA